MVRRPLTWRTGRDSTQDGYPLDALLDRESPRLWARWGHAEARPPGVEVDKRPRPHGRVASFNQNVCTQRLYPKCRTEMREFRPANATPTHDVIALRLVAVG
jgi:hypothetical protein